MHHPNHSLEDVFPSRLFDPETLIDLDELTQDWGHYRTLAWDLTVSSWTNKYRKLHQILPIAPLILVLSMMVLVTHLFVDMNINGMFTISFSLGMLCLLLTLSTLWVLDLTRIGQRMQIGGDLSLYQNVQEWVKNRYHTDYDVTDDLTCILTGEPVEYRKATRLTTVNINGDIYLILKQGAEEVSTK